MKAKSKDKTKYYYIGGVILALAIIITSIILYLNRSYKVELQVDSATYYSANLHKGDTLRKLETPKKEGYTFEGWYVDGEEFGLDTPIEENITLEAKFTKNKYQVAIDADNDTDSSVIEVEYEDTVEEPKTPSKKGYIFKGWYVDDEEYDFNTKIINNTSIIAKWTKITRADYTVEHYLMNLDGTYSDTPNTTETFTGRIGNTVKPEVKSYIGFTSPNVQEVKVLEDDKLVVKYYYERNKYTIDVVGDKGISETKGSGTYYYGETITISYTTKAGYTFTNYSENITDNTYLVGASNKTIKVNSKANTNTKYTVEHYLMDLDGEHYTLDETNTYYGTTDTKATPVVKYHKGFTSPANETVNIDGDGNRVVKYYYTRNQYNLTINKLGDALDYLTLKYNGETIEDSITVYYGQKVTIEASFKQELPLHFDDLLTNWISEDNTATYEITMPNSNTKTSITLNLNTYTVIFHGNKGTTSSGLDSYEQKLKVGINDYPSLISNEYARTGYEFMGWSYDSEASKVDISKDDFNEDGTYQLAKNLTEENNGTFDLYAVWKANKNTVTFLMNDGISKEEYEFYANQDFDTLVTKPETDPTRAGYDFKGWYKDADGNTEWDFTNDTMPNEALTLYAKWEARSDTEYTIENYYMGTDGKYPSNPSETVKGTGTTDAPTGYNAPTKEGFKTPILKESENGQILDITNVTINGDGTTVLKYYYERIKSKLTVSYNSNQVKVNQEIKDKEYYYGEKVTITVTALPGYHFDKYNSNSEKVTADTFTYTIGTSDETITINSVGFKFTVNYHNEEGLNGSMTSDTFTFGDTYQLKGNSFTKEDYILTINNYNGKDTSTQIKFANNFAHWSDETNKKTYENNSNLSEYIPTKDNDTLDLYAVYETVKQEITNPANREGYKFNGFKDGDKSIPEEERINYTISSSKTINADWSVIDYNLKYSTYEGTCTTCTDSTYNIESEKITLPNLAREGYDFNGWIVNGSGTPVKELNPSEHLEETILTTNISSWTAHTYTAAYTDKDNNSYTKICTYDQECVLDSIQSIDIKYHDYIYGVDNTDEVRTYSSLPKITNCLVNSTDCQKEVKINSNNQYYIENLTAENNGQVKIEFGENKLPDFPVRNYDYVFGGWSKVSLEGKNPDINFDPKDKVIGYNDLGDKATFDGEYTYADETIPDGILKELTANNLEIYAIWWERPYVDSVSFNFKDKMSPSTGQILAKSEVENSLNKEGFYVKIPNKSDYFVDVFSLNVKISIKVKLNTKAIPDENYFDLYHNGKGLPIEFLTHIDLPFSSTDNINFATSLPQDNIGQTIQSFLEMGMVDNMFAAPTFLHILMGVGGGGATLGGESTVYKNIGVADKFACNGLACSVHYISIGTDVFGDSYVFVSNEAAMEDLYTIKYVIEDEATNFTEEAISIQIPRGAKIPKVETGTLNVYDFDSSTGTRGEEAIATYNVSEWDYSSEYATGDNKTITITGTGTKTSPTELSTNKEAIILDKSKYLEEIKPAANLVIN